MSTRIKLCGLTSHKDIEMVNRLRPEYVGFVMWDKSHRNIDKKTLASLKSELNSDIKAVGVFVDEKADFIASLLNDNLIDIAQLHGNEDNNYIKTLRELTGGKKEIIKAFKTDGESLKKALESEADMLLFDPGKGDGMTFAWEVLKDFKRPFFLAGGLNSDNVSAAIETLHPFAVDVSSGIETDKIKDETKATAFVNAVRK